MDTNFRYTKTYQKLVENANINSASLLATDYLNHFNEIVMLIEMSADMPEMLAEAKEWVPASYVEHFENSTFSDKKLAIWAYENAPPDFIESFESLVSAADALVLKSIGNLSEVSLNTEPEIFREHVTNRCQAIHEVLQKISAVINGSVVRMNQAEIDELLQT